MAGAGEVLIAGAGIGGLTAALALEREGVACRVFEQAEALREVGAGVSLWPNAMRVFRRLGIFQEVRGDRVPLDRIVLLRRDGAPLMRLRDSGRYAEPALCLHRADLQRTLAAHIPLTRFRPSCRVVGFRAREGGVRVRLQDDTAVDGALLLGCDGIHSAVRSQLHGPGPPAHRGYEIWRGMAEVDLPRTLQGQATEWWGRGSRFGLLPGAPGRVYWYGTRTHDSSSTHDGPSTHGGSSTHDGPSTHGGSRGPEDAGLHRLRSAFSDWPFPAADIVRAVGREVVRTEATDRTVPRRWGRGPVTLLGDAAHPMTPNLGQGSCAAIEDALTLSRCIADGGLTPDALRRYEALRWRRCRWMVRLSRHIGRLGQLRHPLGIGIRDGLLPVLPAFLVERGQGWLYGHEAHLEDIPEARQATSGRPVVTRKPVSRPSAVLARLPDLPHPPDEIRSGLQGGLSGIPTGGGGLPTLRLPDPLEGLDLAEGKSKDPTRP
jgi:2-polyprenyl-6-methoxyphenol hydroxylase-like FAD-dependent oxidoreductase